MGILWFILRLKKALLLGWLAFKSFKARLL
ncbi:hypothetical protein N403_04815 [Helicobacter pylori FD430]|nr:hypothetical protein N403_04815 [Helicobacter pylori FD430]